MLQEFESWKDSLKADEMRDATGFFNVIKRHSECMLEASPLSDTPAGTTLAHDLYIVPYSQEYKPFLEKAAELLHKAADMTDSPRYGHYKSPYSCSLVNILESSFF